jgi:hypothetical protein
MVNWAPWDIVPDEEDVVPSTEKAVVPPDEYGPVMEVISMVMCVVGSSTRTRVRVAS